MLETQSEQTCKTPGCNQPRYRTANQVYTHCQQHQREIFRAAHDKYRPPGSDRTPRHSSNVRTCTVEGCDQPRWNGYPRCQDHQRQVHHTAHLRYKAQRVDQTPSPFTPAEDCPVAEPQTVRIIYADWRENTLVELTATVVSIKPMPETDGEMKKLLHNARTEGVLIAEELP